MLKIALRVLQKLWVWNVFKCVAKHKKLDITTVFTCYYLNSSVLIRRHIFDCHFENFCDELASCIGVLSKIRTVLSLQQRLSFYNAIICPVMSYADVIWSSCDKEPLYRVLKLQKRAARIILYAVRLTHSVTLFL